MIFQLSIVLGVLCLLVNHVHPSHSLLSRSCRDVLTYADPFIGTSGVGYGGGQGSPACQVPFGALRLGPDTTRNFLDIGYRHCSGYNHQDDIVRAFSHVRLVGAGVADLGNFGFMPTIRGDFRDALKVSLKADLWSSLMDKDSEKAAPGLYNVFLKNANTQVDLLAISKFAGIHRYTYKGTTREHAPGIVFDVCHTGDTSNACKAASIRINEDRRTFSASSLIAGSLSGSGQDGGLHVYMYGMVRPVKSSGKEVDVADWFVCDGSRDCAINAANKDINSTNGQLVAHVGFRRPDAVEGEDFQAEVIVAISFVDAATAKENFVDALNIHNNNDINSKSNDDIIASIIKDASHGSHLQSNTSSSLLDVFTDRSQQQWCDALATVAVDALMPGPNESAEQLKTIFYSSLYRSYLTPTQYSEHGGKYMGRDNLLHTTAERKGLSDFGALSYEQFSDLSLWDTFRTAHPFILLTRPDVAVGVLRSMADMAQQVPHMPKWMLANIESNCMIGMHSVAVFAESLYAGLGSSYDIATVQRVAVADASDPATSNRNDIANYLAKGYVSEESAGDAASLTLTFAFDDHSVGVLSDYVGDVASAQAAYARSLNYQTIWSSEREIMCPRYADGSMVCPRTNTDIRGWDYYREGDSEQWRWFVPHDVEGLIKLFKSEAEFEKVLKNFFDEHVKYYNVDGEFMPNPYYWAGNEVDILVPYYFNYVNCTYTQSRSRRLIDMHFHAQPGGLPGNDDYGTMSGFVMFTMLGLYPQAGTSNYYIGSPRVNHAKVFLQAAHGEHDAAIDIIAYNNSEENVYVEKLLINGQLYTNPMIDRNVLIGQFDVNVNMKDVSLTDERRDPLKNPPKGTKLEFYMTNVPKSGLCANY